VDFTQVVGRRRMVRRYLDQPVDPDAVERIVATALHGPSAGFSQGVRLVVVTESERRMAIADLCGEAEHVARGRDPWLSVAPVHVVLCVRPDDYRERYAEPDKAASVSPEDWAVPFWWVDAGAAMMLVLLAAVDEGLGAGVLQIADPVGLRDLLSIPADVEPVALITVGHPADDPGPRGSASRDRRPASESLHYERFTGGG
jgi:nitroreductase